MSVHWNRAVSSGATAAVFAVVITMLLTFTACAGDEATDEDNAAEVVFSEINDIPYESDDDRSDADADEVLTDVTESDGQETVEQEEPTEETDEDVPEEVDAAVEVSIDTDALRAGLGITEDYRSDFDHGDKGVEYQRYVVLHDTEGQGDAESVVSSWDADGDGVAAHFVINKDGSIVQCVSLDRIAHHAGFGDTGHNADYGVEEDERDDRVGTVEIGGGYNDYGMNSYSIGIELVHVGGEGDYPEAQLEALDNLIAYLDAYYAERGLANAGEIIDHKAWRTSNSDTSSEFADYLASYQATRKHL